MTPLVKLFSGVFILGNYSFVFLTFDDHSYYTLNVEKHLEISHSKVEFLGLNRRQTSLRMMSLALAWSFLMALPPLLGWGSYLPEAVFTIVAFALIFKYQIS